MELHRNRWYVHWFFLSLTVCDTFADRRTRHRYEAGTNLCHLMRVNLVWAPLAIAFNLLVYGIVLTALTLAPIYLFGFGGWFDTVVGIVLVVGIIMLVGYLHRAHDRALRARAEKVVVAKVAKQNKGPGFGQVFWSYAVATKQRICPIVTWNEA